MALQNSLLQKIRANPYYTPERSIRWFQDKIRSTFGAGHITSDRMFKSEHANLSTNVGIGDLCLFVYDAKYKDKLPYWDRFPLVFPFDMDKEHFTGLNLHYLPPMMRVRLMDAILQAGSKAYQWQTLKQTSSFPGTKQAVKKYLKSQVRSRFIILPREDWTTAILLPTENFEKASSASVWSKAR